MSYTVIDDGDEICIRATISQRWELAELVTKLQARVDGLPVNITTMIEDPPTVASQEAWLKQNRMMGYTPDAQDVNRKELSNER
jgi:hypothetical protein